MFYILFFMVLEPATQNIEVEVYNYQKIQGHTLQLAGKFFYREIRKPSAEACAITCSDQAKPFNCGAFDAFNSTTESTVICRMGNILPTCLFKKEIKEHGSIDIFFRAASILALNLT